MQEGWNLLTGISSVVELEDIIDYDNIIIEGTIFQFDVGYYPANLVEPGIGYWIRASVDGEVIVQIN